MMLDSFSVYFYIRNITWHAAWCLVHFFVHLHSAVFPFMYIFCVNPCNCQQFQFSSILKWTINTEKSNALFHIFYYVLTCNISNVTFYSKNNVYSKKTSQTKTHVPFNILFNISFFTTSTGVHFLNSSTIKKFITNNNSRSIQYIM